jgi:hypothetical protein
MLASKELPMLYILRMTNGDCAITMAADESGASAVARKLMLEEPIEIATVRPLNSFGVRFSPAEDGSFQAVHWDDATLDGILANEYPLLNEAYGRANAEPLLPTPRRDESLLCQIRTAYARNIDIIREGVRLELQRYDDNDTCPKHTARGSSKSAGASPGK